MTSATQSLAFLSALRRDRIPWPEAEYRFHPVRLWRWDYAWPDQMVAVEVQGGVWTKGRHGRGSGIVKDMEKFSHGAALGWRLLLCQPRDLCDDAFLALLRQALDFGTGKA